MYNAIRVFVSFVWKVFLFTFGCMYFREDGSQIRMFSVSMRVVQDITQIIYSIRHKVQCFYLFVNVVPIKEGKHKGCVVFTN